jgi:hypothetical protein
MLEYIPQITAIQPSDMQQTFHQPDFLLQTPPVWNRVAYPTSLGPGCFFLGF